MTADVETLAVDIEETSLEVGPDGTTELLETSSGTDTLVTETGGDVELLEVHVASPGDFPDLIDLGGPTNGPGA